MYIIKNAVRNILRSKGRNLLIGCIAMVIGLSACLALSIRQAAVSEKANGLANLNVTATISYDRQGMMEKAREDTSENSEEKPDFKDMMKGVSSLSLEEMQTYAKASSVQTFYYTMSATLNGSTIDRVDTSSNEESESNNDAMEKGKGGMRQMENQGDFTLIGYSSYDAMKDFTEENKTITEGELFEVDSATYTCILNEELATLNELSVGDTITLSNPENEKDTYTLKVVGIYQSQSNAQAGQGGMNMAMMDPANQIYLSYAALQTMQTASAKVDEDTAFTGMTNGTYSFADVEDYEAFEAQARELGLSDEYVVSSSDVNAYEQSLAPLENLSTYAGYFLIVILVIGGAILIVLNIYHVKERKYEIGVLAAIGMNKVKIASQFICEIFAVTMLSVLLGTGLGALVSKPVTNTLLAAQSESSEETSFAQMRGGMEMKEDRAMNGKVQEIEEVSSTTDLIVVAQLIGIAIVLTIMAGGLSVMTILRYEPLRILSEREGG